MKPSRHSNDSGPSNHEKLPSIAEIIQADPYSAHHSLRTPPASSSPSPSPIKGEDASLPQPTRPQLSFLHRFRGSSPQISHPRAHTLTWNPAAQARQQHVLDRYPDNQTYKEMLSQIMSLSLTIYNFAQANQRIALKQHTIRVDPARLPQEQEDLNQVFIVLSNT
ncbi:hypothetical protein FGADI_9244 [Fusarium gaditjirri]|uniref:Uncharacterized protein n=1 Tax=Fusarium gaditjirri TaxID=282569 RepID=A0A8H4T0B1_9HYPO|nr:hypothetical protein FGADI_9244 [Fusarium gaditjirri]